MSLLDTFADDLADGGLDVFDADQNLLSTFASGDDDPELRWLLDVGQTDAEPSSAAGVAGDCPAVDAPAADVEFQPAKRKRRKKAKADESGPAPLSRSAICKAAAEARWQKVREDKLSAASSSAGNGGSIAVVIPEAESQIVVADASGQSSAAIVSYLQLPVPPKDHAGDDVKEIFNSGKYNASYTHIGAQLGVCRKTVQRKMRLMASCIFFSHILRASRAVQSVYFYLQSTYIDFRAILHLHKQRFDEMQIRLKISEIPKDMPGWEARIKGDTCTAKILQITTEDSFLFHANGQHIILDVPRVNLLQPIASTHAPLITHTCVAAAGSFDWPDKAFEEKGRLTVADNHPSNGASDYAIYMMNALRTLLRWICFLHANHKTCEQAWKAFPAELTGILNGTMHLRSPGAGMSWKRGVKQFLRLRLKRVLITDEDFLDLEAKKFREQVSQCFAHTDDERLSGPAARYRQKRLLIKRRLCTGNFKNLDWVNHFCPGVDCCRDEAHTLQQFCDDLVDGESFPATWALHRWLGSEDSVDWHAWWLSFNGLYIAGVLMGWQGMTDIEEVIKRMKEIMHGMDLSAELLPTYEECTTDMNSIQRQTTYLKHLNGWLGSHPLSRLWLLKSIIHVQQQHQKK